jgi:hypothetical protein
MDLEEQHAAGSNIIERSAVDLVMRHGGEDEPHPQRWSDDDLGEIHAIERNGIMVAAAAGATSGALIGIVEIIYRDELSLDSASDWIDNWQIWALYFGVAAVVSGIEILLLYWWVLRRAARVGSVAGLGLSKHEFEKVIALGLSRAALEMPNPRTSIYGIDPYAQVPRWQLVAYAVLYRLKIGATSFILRIAMRRLLARAAVRVFIPLVSIPVFAVWNAVVIGWVMRSIQIRAAGPRSVDEIGAWLEDAGDALDRQSRELIVQAVAESIVRARDAHPNFVLLLSRLLRDFGLEDQLERDWSGACERIAALDAPAQELLLRTTIAATVLNGRIRQRQRELLRELHARCGVEYHDDELEALRKEFVRGQGVVEEKLRSVSPSLGDAD